MIKEKISMIVLIECDKEFVLYDSYIVNCFFIFCDI